MNDGLTEKEKQIIAEIKAQLPIVAALPNPAKSRCLMCLAYEYFLMNMEEEAYELLKQADPDYFADQLSKDIKEIPEIETVVMRIMGKLVELGIVTVKTE